MYPDIKLLINGQWRDGNGTAIPVLNPATGGTLATVAHAGRADLDAAIAAAQDGFRLWRDVAAHERCRILRKAATLIRQRAPEIATLMTLEQGKPLAEAQAETLAAGDLIEWFAEEGKRTYGRLIPSRSREVTQMVVREPVGVVAAFTPWNFPINQAVRKVSAALASGCSVILKGPEETPASCAELIRAYVDAGVPAGVVNLVFGNPADISSYLIAHPTVRKVTFTGSTEVGKLLAAQAGQHMKRVTMELGGHAPAIVFDDADVERAAKLLAAAKFRNAGQVCVSPTRFLVQDASYDRFVEVFVQEAGKIRVGNGLDEGTTMGPLANPRRVAAMERLVADAVAKGATVAIGGKRLHGPGNFFEPTVLVDVPADAAILHEEPFGPVAPIVRFQDFDEVVKEANRLPFGLAAYAYTSSARIAGDLTAALECGMLSINHHGLALPEVPFGGVKDSGYGSEGGAEAMEPYLNTKFVTQLRV
ncbi:NAD-dependent succinate-semialdehyde dehydrogenase [Cupriavidus sp. AU9028]|uniref:NAD-dependent succinate-semialdehyde dehydrogenase n=1 Tax=Cupriavidus sp. AU9028 TaxID=2871157 RepID=UPI001C94237A|nr:NAD-dependent succinate-semialdehyde dehydrogenase [Cupriavidus sp. AU9028]MBY4897794.1 NAD-dependent succinate-semialdehyde dehydrogenase [Cupriavidus sp. AU9028]